MITHLTSLDLPPRSHLLFFLCTTMITGSSSRIYAASKAAFRPNLPASASSCRARSLHYLRPTVTSSLHAGRRSLPKQTPVHQSAPHRSFSQSCVSRASLASHPPGENSELVHHPTPESLRELEDGDDFDIDLVPLEEAQLQMTERAAEVRIICFQQIPYP